MSEGIPGDNIKNDMNFGFNITSPGNSGYERGIPDADEILAGNEDCGGPVLWYQL